MVIYDASQFKAQGSKSAWYQTSTVFSNRLSRLVAVAYLEGGVFFRETVEGFAEVCGGVPRLGHDCEGHHRFGDGHRQHRISAPLHLGHL
jgi:hypothetical protein